MAVRVPLAVFPAVVLVVAVVPALHAASPGIVNVCDFGAKGDGVTDDTLAILAAMKAASITLSQPSPVGCYYQAGPVVVFPAGEYVLSGEIPISALEVRGEGRAVLRQTRPDRSILRSNYAWRMAIRNLTFIGGKDQIRLYNPNVDTGQIIIDHCRFYGAGGFGLRTDVLSTTVKVQDCEFIMCRQSWYLHRSDQAVMRDCWITTGSDVPNVAAIEHRGGRLTIENLCGVPLVGAPRTRWIDNYGFNLTLKQCRFGGEGGGFTPVYNFTRYSPSTFGSTILFEDCFLSANASYGANCAVYCFEVPNSIIIRDCTFSGCVPVLTDRVLDLSTYFTNVAPSLLCYSVENCSGEVMGDLLEGLRHPIINRTAPAKPILSGEETAAALALARQEWAARPDEPFTGGVANGHVQRVGEGEYVELTDWAVVGNMDATSQTNSDWLVLDRVGSDTLILFRQDQPGGWPHVTIRARVDVDRFPWLTWKQKQGTAPGAFALKVIDLDLGVMRSLYAETQWGEYDYHADNLKELFGVTGVRDLEIRYYPLASGWEYPSAKAGQYVVMDFMRMEAD